MSDNKPHIPRRRLLQATSVALTAGLAGCAGGEAEDEERVPEVVIDYWADVGASTKVFEDTIPSIVTALEELGVETSVEPMDFSSQVDRVFNDTRGHQLQYQTSTSSPSRLDPGDMTDRYMIQLQGSCPGGNATHYASCEYSTLAAESFDATSVEEREELSNEAHSVMSNDKAAIPTLPRLGFGAYLTDKVDIGGLGESGMTVNPTMFFKSSPRTGDTIITNANPPQLETMNFPVISGASFILHWNQTIHSPLFRYNEDYDLVNDLAEDYEVTNEAQTIRVELKPDAVFHNGDQVTAEDVKFTFEHLSRNDGVYPRAADQGYDSIEVIDDQTVEFNFPDPSLPFITRTVPRWGILHKEFWEDGGAVDDPEGFNPDEMIGNGPFQIEHTELGDLQELRPFDDHPTYSPDYNLIFQVYRDETTLTQAFQQEEVDIVTNVSIDSAERIRDEMSDGAEVVPSSDFTSFYIYPATHYGPTKFEEFRDALGTAINRQEMNDIAFLGQNEPDLFSCPLGETHPWRPPDDMLHQFTDDLSGDVEAARQKLADAGWRWDDDGNLRYPEDADLSPLWPEGESPDPDDFPCLDADCELGVEEA